MVYSSAEMQLPDVVMSETESGYKASHTHS